jgi:hypothetical protein
LQRDLVVHALEHRPPDGVVGPSAAVVRVEAGTEVWEGEVDEQGCFHLRQSSPFGPVTVHVFRPSGEHRSYVGVAAAQLTSIVGPETQEGRGVRVFGSLRVRPDIVPSTVQRIDVYATGGFGIFNPHRGARSTVAEAPWAPVAYVNESLLAGSWGVWVSGYDADGSAEPLFGDRPAWVGTATVPSLLGRASYELDLPLDVPVDRMIDVRWPELPVPFTVSADVVVHLPSGSRTGLGTRMPPISRGASERLDVPRLSGSLATAQLGALVWARSVPPDPSPPRTIPDVFRYQWSPPQTSTRTIELESWLPAATNVEWDGETVSYRVEEGRTERVRFGIGGWQFEWLDPGPEPSVRVPTPAVGPGLTCEGGGGFLVAEHWVDTDLQDALPDADPRRYQKLRQLVSRTVFLPDRCPP